MACMSLPSSFSFVEAGEMAVLLWGVMQLEHSNTILEL